VLAEGIADHFGDGDTLFFGSADEQVLELRVEAYRLDGGRLGAEAWAAALAPSGDEGIGVTAAFGFVGEPVDKLVGDRRSGLGVAVGSLGHWSRSLR
jgi:hypothetical protein